MDKKSYEEGSRKKKGGKKAVRGLVEKGKSKNLTGPSRWFIGD